MTERLADCDVYTRAPTKITPSRASTLQLGGGSGGNRLTT
jgi:hypothetical protein